MRPPKPTRSPFHPASGLRRVRSLFVFLFLAMTVLGPAKVAQAQAELQTLNLDGVSKSESPTAAASEIQAHVVDETARQQVIEMIGEKRYQKNKAQVEAKVIRQAAKFMPFVQPGTIVKLPDGSWKMPVEIRLSVASLRKMVLDLGLMNDSDGAASVIPMIAFVDRIKNVQVRWWMGEEKDDTHKYLALLSHDFYDKLQAEFSHQGFHLIRPQGTAASSLPEAFRNERLSVSDLKSISDYYQAQLLMKGDVRVRESRDLPGAFTINVRIQVVQTQSARTVAELSRSFDTDTGTFEAVVRNKMRVETPEIAKDLAGQVLDAWQRGTMNANLVKLALRGNLTPKQVGDFKLGLGHAMHEVKSVRERLFEPGQVTLEIDYTGEPAQFIEKVKTAQLPGFQMTTAELFPKGIVMQVKAVR